MTNKIFKSTVFAVTLIAVGSFALSYAALVELAAANGVKHNLAYIWPLIVDASVIVFTAAILVAQLQKRGAKLPIALTGFYAVVTIAGNILHAPATALGWFVAALPPLSLIFATEMLRAMAHHNIVHSTITQSLAGLQQQAQQKQSELAKLDAQLQQRQQQMEAIDIAKTSNNDDFASIMQTGKQAKLNERRQTVLRLHKDGLSDKEIAEQLSKDVRTIRSDIKALNGQVAK